QFPGYRLFAQHIEHGSFATVECQVGRWVTVLAQLVPIVETPERGSSVHEGPVGPGLARNRTEPAVADCEFFGQLRKHRHLLRLKRLHDLFWSRFVDPGIVFQESGHVRSQGLFRLTGLEWIEAEHLLEKTWVIFLRAGIGLFVWGLSDTHGG